MKKSFRTIIITGFMGAGKTSVASALARLLDCTVIDLDSFINEREGRRAQTIIEEDGEARFRELESAALRDVLEKNSARIIALGGGTWTRSDNRALIRQHDALTVWLDAPFELCWHRIENGREARPLAPDAKSARALYDERRPLYEEAALRIEINEGKSAESIAAEIKDALAASSKGKR